MVKTTSKALLETNVGKSRVSKYVFQNESEINQYVSVLHDKTGPCHSSMALLRTALAARAFQVQNLKRKHLNFGKEASFVYLPPMKGHEGQWVQLPKCLRQRFKAAAQPDGLTVKVQRACGNRPSAEIPLTFKITGGCEGMGSSDCQEDYVFTGEFSGTVEVFWLHHFRFYFISLLLCAMFF